MRVLKLLKEFEKRDVSLASKLDAKHAEKSDIVSRVAECQVIGQHRVMRARMPYDHRQLTTR